VLVLIPRIHGGNHGISTEPAILESCGITWNWWNHFGDLGDEVMIRLTSSETLDPDRA
jgi:hypothetical protein